MANGPDDVANQIDQIVEAASQEFTHAELTELGYVAQNIIILRTKAGKDADLAPFAPYSEAYKKERVAAGLSERPDLARTGQMLGAMIPQAGTNEVTLRFLSAFDAMKAVANNEGIDKTETVRSHGVGSYTRKVQHYTKTGKVRTKKQTVGAHAKGGYKRRMKREPREFFDVRATREVDVLEESIGRRIVGRVEKVLAR